MLTLILHRLRELQRVNDVNAKKGIHTCTHICKGADARMYVYIYCLHINIYIYILRLARVSVSTSM